MSPSDTPDYGPLPTAPRRGRPRKRKAIDDSRVETGNVQVTSGNNIIQSENTSSAPTCTPVRINDAHLHSIGTPTLDDLAPTNTDQWVSIFH